MQKINLRELYPDVYKTDVFVDVAEEVMAAIRGQEQDDAAYERRKFRHKAHYSLNREDGIENDALNRSLTPEEVLEQKLFRSDQRPCDPDGGTSGAMRARGLKDTSSRPAKDLGGTLRRTLRTTLRSYDSRASGDLLCSHRQGAWQM